MEYNYSTKTYLYTCTAQKVHCLNGSQINIENAIVFRTFFLSFLYPVYNIFFQENWQKDSHKDAPFHRKSVHACNQTFMYHEVFIIVLMYERKTEKLVIDRLTEICIYYSKKYFSLELFSFL